ncbi:hypothetical protein TKK_0010462 [Trichogramma kaykai]
MLNLFFSSSILPQSRYLIDKLFNHKEDITYHALCPKCKRYIKQFDRDNDYMAQCEPCEFEFGLKDPSYVDYFVTINPEKEIAYYLEKNWFYYESVAQRRNENNRDLKDFYDGLCYKYLMNSLPDEKKSNFVTATFNSDGSPVFESSTFSVWPIQIIINETPLKVRMNNPIVCGLWFGKHKPDMNVFLEPFVHQMNQLANDGITISVPQESHKIFVYAICSCVDSVARTPMQGITQYNITVRQ